MTFSYKMKPFVVESELQDGSIKFCSTQGRSFVLPPEIAQFYKTHKGYLFSTSDENHAELNTEERNCISSLQKELLEAGLAEGNTLNRDMISARYRSQMTFFSIFDGPEQKRHNFYQKIRQANVIIVGMGGVGSHVAMALVLAGFRKVILVDYDIIEESNLNEQFLYTYKDLRKKKTEIATNKLKELNPDVEVRSVDVEVTSTEDVQELLDNVDFLCCAADFPFHYIYRWINEACVSRNIPWIQANSAESTGFLGPLVVPGTTSCYGCIEEQWKRNDSNYLFEIDQLNQDKSLYHEKASSLSAGIGILGNFAALEIIKHITGFARPDTLDNQVSIEFGAMDFHRTEFERLKDCPVCG